MATKKTTKSTKTTGKQTTNPDKKGTPKKKY